MKLVGYFVLAIAVVLPARARADAETDFPCAGRWRGLGKNTGFPDFWTIDMFLHPPDAKGVCGTIEYGDPDCGGVLVECTGSTQMRVRELYMHGAKNCAPPGYLVFSCHEGGMDWEWHGWEIARSKLRRVDVPQPPPRVDPPKSEPPAPISAPEAEAPVAPLATRERAGGCNCRVGSVTQPARAQWFVVAMIVALARALGRQPARRS